MKSNVFNAHGMRLGAASAWMKLVAVEIVATSAIICGAVPQDASRDMELPQTEQFSVSEYNVARQRLETRLTEVYQSCSGTFEELRTDHPQEVRQLLLEFKDLLDKRRDLPQTDGSVAQLERVVALLPEVEAYAQRVPVELERLRSLSNSSRRREIQLFEKLEGGLGRLCAGLASDSSRPTSRRREIEMFEKLGECLSRLREHPLTMPIFWGVFIYCLVSYVIAYVCTLKGWMVTYSGWGDFFMSSLWLMLTPAGLLLWYLKESNLVSFVGVAFIVIGGVSVVWLLLFAVVNNRRSVLFSIVAIGTRIAVSVLVVVVLSRLQEKWEEYKRGESGVVKGLVIPLLVVTLIYKIFVHPLIGRRT